MRGHIFRRTRRDGRPGRWAAVVDLPPIHGRRRQASATFATRQQAEAWVAERVARRVLGGPTVTQYLRSWLDGRQALRPSTRRSYADHVANHLAPALGDLPVLALTPGDVAVGYRTIAERAQAAGRPLGPATLRRIHATLHAALHTAVVRGQLGRNPAQTVELPPPVHRAQPVWTPEQAATFLLAMRDDPHYPLWLLATLRGLRRGELLALRWDDLDLSKGTFTWRRQLVQVGGEVVEGEPKTRAGARTLALDGGTVTVLRRHHTEQLRQRLAAGEPWVDTGLVFTDDHGSAIRPAWLSRRFTRLAAEAGLPQIRLHDLRHTSASLGLEAGETLKEVQHRLGHSSIGVTMDTYAQVSRDLARRSAQRVADLLDRHARGPGGVA